MNSTSFISSVINQKKTCLFFSPHFDDAILSCSEIIERLRKKTNVQIINIFTKASPGPYTISAKKFLRDSGRYLSAEKLFSDRSKEDAQIYKSLNIPVTNLGLTDALFRQSSHHLLEKLIPELIHTYPTYRWHIHSVNKNDKSINKLKKMLKRFDPDKYIAIVPLGIGNHVDHLITKQSCEKHFKHIYYYADFPYSVREKGKKTTAMKNRIEFKVNKSKKRNMLQQYQTQFLGLFPENKIPDHSEVICF